MATPLPASLLPSLHASDNTLYPSPLTLATLESWHHAAPHLFLSLPAGVILALPLPLHTHSLVASGTLREWEINASHLASAATPKAIGIHVYHVERTRDGARGFAAAAVRAVAEEATRAGWRVERWSALCVTDAGRGAFRALGWKENRDVYEGQVVVGGALVERRDWDRKGEVTVEARMLVCEGESGVV
ncbi:hypothetical protein EDC01DRAFT_665380 [Geopyxis carbonaria]|nr:hypothetical protein EDC01DRAFT_665380 [Geopyxis carbonaria]